MLIDKKEADILERKYQQMDMECNPMKVQVIWKKEIPHEQQGIVTHIDLTDYRVDEMMELPGGAASIYETPKNEVLLYDFKYISNTRGLPPRHLKTCSVDVNPAYPLEVLLVDPDQQTRALIKKELGCDATRAYSFTDAASFEDALSVITHEKTRFDIVIVDYIDREDMAAFCREACKMKPCIIILYASDITYMDCVAAVTSGVRYTLNKNSPHSLEILGIFLNIFLDNINDTAASWMSALNYWLYDKYDFRTYFFLQTVFVEYNLKVQIQWPPEDPDTFKLPKSQFKSVLANYLETL
jgi:CheY-like chemotaxis protein